MTFEQDSELLCKAMVDLIQVNDSVFMINEGKGVERDDFIDKTYFINVCLLYTSPSPRDQRGSRMPSSA